MKKMIERKTGKIFQEEYSDGIISIIIAISVSILIGFVTIKVNIVLAIVLVILLTLILVYPIINKGFKKIVLNDEFIKIVYAFKKKKEIINISYVSNVSYVEHLSRTPSYLKIFLDKKKVVFRTRTPEDALQILLYFHNKGKNVEITPKNGIVQSKFNELIDKSSDS